MSLNVLDTAVGRIYNVLGAEDVLDNTYIIFASDNGGCPIAGSSNYPLRGTKGSLFEGGVHVEAFISGPGLIPADLQGTTSSNLFHVNDWFKTILSMADIKYTHIDGYELDGFSQFDSLFNGADNPREYMLVNYYAQYTTNNMNIFGASETQNIYGDSGSLYTSDVFAVMSSRYKLMHTFASSAGYW
jgi:arylsulfatase A-like enzyme